MDGRGRGGVDVHRGGHDVGPDPTPRYPTQQAVDNGQCVKGWLLFEVPSSIKIDQIRYSAPGDGTATPMLSTSKG
jgi:hypothetical protein